MVGGKEYWESARLRGGEKRGEEKGQKYQMILRKISNFVES